MGLMEDVQAAAHPVNLCKFARWLIQQDKKYQQEIADVLAGDFNSNVIWRVLASKHGQFVSASVFGRHRRGECSCDI